jgi:hypothetical protein
MSKLSSSLQGDVCLWATHAGAELDLLVSVAGRRYGFEFKYADASGRRHSMHIADAHSAAGPPA